MTTCYSLGFAFNPDMTQVALIKKLRPEWQAGFLNGIGGHVESKETFKQCVGREFYEETGVATLLSEWRSVAHIERERVFVCQVYMATLSMKDWGEIRTTTDEQVEKVPVEELYKYRHRLLPNLLGLIGMCFDTQHPSCHLVYQ